MQCVPLGAHSCNHVEFHVNVPLCMRLLVGNSVLFLLHRKRSVSGHVSHHDRCCVGSVRVSDSVAEIPISAAPV